ncbi:MAG: tRNA uridine-5-carboxymethylaminomethyl(34) synthesis GTPase MnmE [Ruminococcaceae bacterium]|nr:tRNA uridine-5-carboxymethylaminomethyl(34) synthesis GTPase MnmE [Oscillospiraceae bacterium]
MQEKTIAALATPPGVGGIAVIRLSGAKAIEIADTVFWGKTRLCDAPTHTVHYGFIKNKAGEKVDEVLATVMRAPRTFTREDVVEISTHGGIRVSQAVMQELLRAGAFPAEPGEFTKRAFLNGRIDLSQAEAVIDIINSRTELAGKNALSQAEGSLFREIEALRNQLVSLAASMQVSIDYPDEDLEDMSTDEMLQTVCRIHSAVEALLSTANSGRIISEGIRTAIVGRPNVGKSSLLNRLSRTDRAIVTDIAGTTRDVIEETVDLDGVLLRLADTAGIRETEDTVEKIGVERSLESMQNADLILVVLDATKPLSQEDFSLLNTTKGMTRILILNKTDSAPSSLSDWEGEPVFPISAKTGNGISALSAEIRTRFGLGEIAQSNGLILTNLRHTAALLRAKEALKRMISAFENGIPQDLATIDLNLAIDALGEISGASVSEDIVSAIFHQFCVGK